MPASAYVCARVCLIMSLHLMLLVMTALCSSKYIGTDTLLSDPHEYTVNRHYQLSYQHTHEKKPIKEDT